MQLYHTCDICGGTKLKNALSGNESDELEQESMRVARSIYDGTIEKPFDKKMAVMVSSKLSEAITEGYGNNLPSVAWNSPDYNMLINLERNVYSFSAAKNYQQLKAMTEAMKDGDNVRSWSDYRKEVARINDVFNSNWLRTEYDTAIGSAQMAGKWVQFERDKDIYENLEYDTAGDSKVRPAHAVLDGVTLPKDDPFWNTYYPPNGWKCRCDVRQTKKQQTEVPGIDVDKTVPKLFRTNLAKSGLAFPNDHAYYNGKPDNKSAVMQIQRTIMTEWGKEFLKGSTVHNSTLGDVEFTNTGIKEAINQPHKHYVEKNFALFHVQAAIINAKEGDIISMSDQKGKDTGSASRTYYYIPIEIAGETSYINIHKLPEGPIRFYSITENIRK